MQNLSIIRIISKTVLCIGLLAASMVVIAIATVGTAKAVGPGCYVVSQGNATAANCPPSGDSNGANFDPAKCYFATGGSRGIGTFSERPCEGENTSGDSPSSNLDRPGSASNNCLTNRANCDNLNTTQFVDAKDQCGKGENKVDLSVNIGCFGDDYPNPTINPIIDMAFAFFRFMSAGVILVIIGSIIYAGIQYSASRGNPQAVELSMKRVINTVIALLLFIFLLSITNFLVPGGLFI